MSNDQTTFENLVTLIGKEGAINLCQQLGGQTIYVRKTLAETDSIEGHWMTFFGERALERLTVEFGGQRIYIPAVPPELLEERNKEIVRRLKLGESATAIAQDYLLTPRCIHMIFQRRNAE
jgi:Mor family transcriptional regulator